MRHKKMKIGFSKMFDNLRIIEEKYWIIDFVKFAIVCREKFATSLLLIIYMISVIGPNMAGNFGLVIPEPS